MGHLIGFGGHLVGCSGHIGISFNMPALLMMMLMCVWEIGLCWACNAGDDNSTSKWFGYRVGYSGVPKWDRT